MARILIFIEVSWELKRPECSFQISNLQTRPASNVLAYSLRHEGLSVVYISAASFRTSSIPPWENQLPTLQHCVSFNGLWRFVSVTHSMLPPWNHSENNCGWHKQLGTRFSTVISIHVHSVERQFAVTWSYLSNNEWTNHGENGGHINKRGIEAKANSQVLFPGWERGENVRYVH